MLPRLAIAFLAGLLILILAAARPVSTAEAGEPAPDEVVEQFFAEVSAGDAEGALALVSEDFILREITYVSFAAVGRTAFGAVVEEVIAANATATLSDLEVEDNTVTGSVTWMDDNSAAAGVDRYIQPFTIVVGEDGLLASADISYDASDAQTVEYIEYRAEQFEAGEGEPPAGAIIVPLGAQPGGNQPGVAAIFGEGQVTSVFLEISPGPAGQQQPAHFHTGTCASPGPVVHPLANVIDGVSITYLSAAVSELIDTGLIINVHLSPEQITAYVSCGEVRSQAAEPTPPAAPTTAPTATAATGVTAPDTGAGPANPGGAPFWLYAALLAAGGLVIAAGLRVRAH